MRLTEKIFAYFWQGRGNNCNTYLITGEKNILIDPGHLVSELGERCLEQLSSQMLADGKSLEQVDLIICTHAHPDHCGSVEAVQEKSGARLALHKEEVELWEKWKEYLSSTGSPFPSLKPDFFLQEGELQMGTDNSEVLHMYVTPGHTSGSICIYEPQGKALFTGDTIFSGSIGRTDLPGGDMREMAESIKRRSTLEDVELLLPGHMGPVKRAERVKSNIRLIRNYFF